MNAEDAEKKWTHEQQVFIDWLALPKRERQPKTQRLLAKEIGIDETTLGRWKRLPGFADAVIQTSREFIKDAIPEVLDALRRGAIKGSIAHIDRVLAMAGLGADVATANSQRILTAGELTDDQLAVIATRGSNRTDQAETGP